MEDYPGRVATGYTEEMSHLIQAGTDIFLMPALRALRSDPDVQPELWHSACGHGRGRTMLDTIIPYPQPGANGFIFAGAHARGPA